MSNWKSLARKTNSLPEGWNSADEIAADLDCEPNEVPKILAASIRDKIVEKQTFPHWQPGSRQLLYQTGYRQTGKPQAKEPTTRVPGIPDHLLDRVRQICQRHPGRTASQLADLCRWRDEPRIKATAIRALLDKPTP
jgi:hypothetical protein